MHHHTQFGSKRVNDSEDIIWTNTDNLTLRCDLDLKCKNPFFYPPQDTLAYDDVSVSQIWLPRIQRHIRYSRKSHFDHVSPRCDLDPEDSKLCWFFFFLA